MKTFSKQTLGLKLACCSLGAAAFLSLAACNGGKKEVSHPSAPSQVTGEKGGEGMGGKLAYVNLDTLGAKYEFFKKMKADFEAKSTQMEAEVERLAKNFQNEYTVLQNKAKAGTLSREEGEAAEKKLGQMQQNIEARRQTLGSQLMKEQEAFNEELQKRMDEYLIKYNQTKGYDFIFSYAKGGGILFANPSLDITEDVIHFMNEQDKGKSPTDK